MGKNPNYWYIGKTVQIVGAHNFKGITGTIRDASPLGHCDIELHINNRLQLQRLPLSTVRIVYVFFVYATVI